MGVNVREIGRDFQALSPLALVSKQHQYHGFSEEMQGRGRDFQLHGFFGEKEGGTSERGMSTTYIYYSITRNSMRIPLVFIADVLVALRLLFSGNC